MKTNFAIAAESMDIGSCIIGSVIGYLQKLGLSEGYQVLYTIALGYKNEHPVPKPREVGKVQVIK